MSDYDQKSALAFNSSKVLKVLSDRRFRFAECIIPPKLNNRSTGADDGIIMLYLRNNSDVWKRGKNCRYNPTRTKKLQNVFQIQITPKNVIEIQNTNYISNFIKIQNTNYSKCILNTYFNYFYFNYFTTLAV